MSELIAPSRKYRYLACVELKWSPFQPFFYLSWTGRLPTHILNGLTLVQAFHHSPTTGNSGQSSFYYKEHGSAPLVSEPFRKASQFLSFPPERTRTVSSCHCLEPLYSYTHASANMECTTSAIGSACSNACLVANKTEVHIGQKA